MPPTADEVPNNSGTGEPAPPEVRAMGFCRPAYYMPTLWRLAFGIGDFRAWVGGVWARLHLGTYGYQLAWMNRRFRSFEEFRSTMTVWKRWTSVLMALWVAVAIAGVVGLFLYWVFDWRR